MNHPTDKLGAPVEGKQRHIILDALRGIALLGICLANFPEFSLYSFLDKDAAEALPTAGTDHFVKYLLYIFIDGKFYTIFSLLFGIGFSIILANNRSRGANGTIIFYRRMCILLIIGFAHLMLLWSGDILMLYALIGMLLPLFLKMSDRTILCSAILLLALPIAIDYSCEAFGISLSSQLTEWQWQLCHRYGITEQNFAYWLSDADSYRDIFKFLCMGSVERMQEFVYGNRYFKVLGLFLIGFYIGRNRLYARLSEHTLFIKRICTIGLLAGLPLSALYAWSAISGHPLGTGTHTLLYFISVYITSFGYIAALSLIYLKHSDWRLWRLFSYPGRMALTNYLGQSVAGIIIFYGIGFGLGSKIGLVYADLIALAVFILEILLSCIWLRHFRFGPFEWLWRCLTYKRLFPLR